MNVYEKREGKDERGKDGKKFEDRILGYGDWRIWWEGRLMGEEGRWWVSERNKDLKKKG